MEEKKKRTMDGVGMVRLLQSMDIVSIILRQLSSPEDILAASAVCRVWRMVATEPAHLRSWTLDDSCSDFTMGLKTSSTPLLPKTPPPKHWINPSAHSPLAFFKVPKSLGLPSTPSIHSSTHLQGTSDEHAPSPRTPSPVREPSMRPCSILKIVKEKMVMGRFLGDVDIMSARINDEAMQLLFKKCRYLHTFRLLHICTPKADCSDLSSTGMEARDLSCGCSLISERAFFGIHKYCPELASVTLILQHVTFRNTLQKIFMELGMLSKLQTLSVELRMPSFGQSTKSKLIWESHVRVTDQELNALIQAGPPLRALALNRCDLTKVSLATLTSTCPQIEALELHSDCAIKREGDLETAPTCLKGMGRLSAAAFGVLDLPRCDFGRWVMPALKRLRLEASRMVVGAEELEAALCKLRRACPQLESLHLIWGDGAREAHLYPFSQQQRDAFLLLRHQGRSSAVLSPDEEEDDTS